jgi:hypothetical protein
VARFYREKPIPKPDGTVRVLWIPSGCLREVQDLIKCHIFQRVRFRQYVHGGVKGKSAKTFARQHTGRDILLGLDIKNCFPSIGLGRIRAAFQTLGFSGEALGLLVKLTTWQFQLPQGPPTSPYLANLVLDSVDRRQSALAKQHGCTYGRFVDDIGISGGQRLRRLQGLHERVVLSEGFALKPPKPGRARLMDRNHQRQSILNLVVNEKVNLPKEARKAIVLEVSAALRAETTLSDRQTGKLAWLRFVNPNAASGIDRKARMRRGR